MQFISKGALDRISYTTSLGKSLKQISMSKTPLSDILADINKYRLQYTDTIIQENLIGSRFKSDDSIMRKYKKTLQTGGGFKQCFNDVLGFRLRLDVYPKEYPEYFRVVDLRNGKKIDDGYRAIHLYYQRDHLAYPIEIQLWCADDYQFNIWSHKLVYKYHDAKIGKYLYENYKVGKIRTEEEFKCELNKLMKERSSSNGTG